MKDRIFRFIKSDSVLKVFSVLLAFVIWLVIVAEINPLGQKSLRVAYVLDVEAKTVETKDGVTLKNIAALDTRVEVTVKGRQESIDNVTDDDVTISLDLSEVTSSGEQEVPVVVKSDKVGVSVSDYTPKTVTVNFEKIVEATIPVEVKVEDGVLQAGYVVAKTSVTPETLQLRGFESVISKISTARVYVEKVDISVQIDQSKSFRMICKYYDASGNEVTDFKNTEMVDIEITAGKTIPLNYNITGEPAENSYVKEISITPKSVVVIGPPAVLNDMASLDTSEINIEGMQEDVSQIVEVILPYGVSLADATIRPTVSIKLGGIIEKQFALKSENITMSGTSSNYVYTIQSVGEITLKGRDTILDGVDVSALKGRINVNGLGEGVHQVQVSVSGLPSDVVIATGGYAEATVSVREVVVATPTPTQEPTQEPSTAPTQEPTTPPEPTPTPDSSADPVALRGPEQESVLP